MDINLSIGLYLIVEVYIHWQHCIMCLHNFHLVLTFLESYEINKKERKQPGKQKY
jgi:hypothetical protein